MITTKFFNRDLSDKIKHQNVLLSIIVLFIVFASLYFLKSILIPVSIAICLTLLLHPVHKLFVRIKIPAPLSLLLILCLLSVSLYIMTVLFVSTINSFSGRTDFYLERLTGLLDEILSPLNLSLQALSEKFNSGTVTILSEDMIKNIISSGVFQQIFSSLSSMLSDIFIVLLLWLFMMAGKDNFTAKLSFVLKENHNSFLLSYQKIDKYFQMYIGIKLLMGFSMAVISYIGLALFGIDFALLWAILMIFLHFIPTLGSIIATLLPLTITLLQFGFGWIVIIVGLFLFLVQFIIGNVVEPRYLGKHLDLSPMVVLLSLLLWGWLWGIPGMLLSVPITAVIKIIIEANESQTHYAILLSNKNYIHGKEKTTS